MVEVMIKPNTKQRRSQVTNGKRLFLGDVDGRSTDAMRWRDVYNNILKFVMDPNEIDRQQVRRLTSVVLLCEQMEARLVSGDERFNLDGYLRAIGTAQRLMGSLGIFSPEVDEQEKSFRRRVEPELSLQDYLQSRARGQTHTHDDDNPRPRRRERLNGGKSTGDRNG